MSSYLVCSFAYVFKQLLHNHLILDDGFKRQVLRQLSIITIKLDQLSEDYKHYQHNNVQSEAEVVDSIFTMFNFPLQEDELGKFEEYISITEHAKQFVSCKILHSSFFSSYMYFR